MTESEGRAPQQSPANTQPDTDEISSGVRQVADLKRRREASRRLPPLQCGHADPWQPWRAKPSEKLTTAAAEAAAHLLAQGLTPIFSVDTISALRRRDPELAKLLALLRGAVA